ncbi:NAD(P)-dependent alcohol dehydrogenase [Rhodococcus sp. NPDC058505]|uniref:NAD(P)-dependent alcohol dehydrogenase n=1 Tax=unclassified Rhodococcus (in: high G+C Gram-positive bacteria) TaxID=192944 RepID=UPI00364B259A
MRALQLTGPGVIEVRDVPVPELGPSDLLIRVGAAGLCHSDLHLLHFPVKMREEPLTLGHEIAGTIEAVGDAVDGRSIGERGVIYLCWSCGVCRECLTGNENVCLAAGRTAMPPCPGLGPDGGMADYVRVPARSFVPIGDLDFLQAAPIADAALTSCHAIRGARDHLGPGSTAVVIGVGGLGHVAVQILRAASATRVVAVDVGDDRLALAAHCGAEVTFESGPDTARRILDLTGGRGADAVFDFVGIDATARMAVESVAPNGAYRMIGLGGGVPGVTADAAGGPGWPWGASVRKSYGGTRGDLVDAITLAQTGRLVVAVERFDLRDARNAFDRLEAGHIRGRAVLVP